MTPAELEKLHGAAFPKSRGWRANEFEALLAKRGATLVAEPHGFALARTIAGESELLTIAVDPAHQGHGIGARLMHRWLSEQTIDTAFLEVAADNLPALALYRRFGFETVGTRAGYYTPTDGPPVDALTLRRDKSG